MFKIGVFALIFDKQKRILLCHRNDHDLWNLPGGGLEAGEAPWDGIVREVLEETGLEVEVHKLSSVCDKGKRNIITFNFICNVKSGTPTLTDEADKIEYFSLENIPKNTPPRQLERIKIALEKPEETHFFTQHGPPSIELLKQGKL